MTVAATILNGVYSMNNFLPLEDCPIRLLRDGLTDYAIYVQVLLVLSINLVLLNMMYKYVIKGGQRRSTWRACCSKYSFQAEVVFVLSVLFWPILLPVVEMAASSNANTKEGVKKAVAYLFYTLLAIDLVLSVTCTTVLFGWFWRVRRRKLLKYRMNEMCREMSLVGWFIVFVVMWSVSTVLESFEQYDVWYVIFPIVQSITPISFIMYLCLIMRQSSRSVRSRNLDADQVTCPPSTRESAESYTDANPLEFLSPSTARPTEHTPLMKDKVKLFGICPV